MTDPPARAARPVPDLRAPMLAVVAWGAALLGLLAPAWLVVATVVLVVTALAGCWRHGRLGATAVGWALVGLVVLAATLLQLAAVASSPVRALARDEATVRTVLRVGSDPVTRQGRFGGYVVVRARVLDVVGRGRHYRVRAPVLVIADRSWSRVRLGSRVEARGRLDAADGQDLSAVLAVRGPPRELSRPHPVLRVAEGLRAGVRESVSPRSAGPRALVPALVDGDGTGLPDQVVADFRVSGLTHLLAVSGTNLTLTVGFVLVLARWAGVRARGLVVVGALGVAGFVVLARAEPSVVRAAAMGSVALLGMGTRGRERGTRALGVAVAGVFAFDPWLAASPGFALSASATAGILFLGPPWREALARWLPRWVAEAVAVPLAAQIACTPLVAALSGQVSLVAVAANLLVAGVVGPATVLGLVGGLTAAVWPWLGQLVAWPAAWCATWIIVVARHSAAVPVAALGWGVGLLSLTTLTAGCLLLALVLGPLLARRGPAVAATALALTLMLVPLPTPGWPPRGWVLVACDVGQGDGLVLNAGAAGAVVVDAGPDPTLMDACLRRLGVRRVPLVVLTHFHADHVDGLAGVLRHRRVGAIEVTDLVDPAQGARGVRLLARRARVPVRVAAYGETAVLGPLHWQVLAPSEDPPADSGSPPNDSSIVMLVATRGIRILMMGDEEPPSQERLSQLVPRLRVDVLKVAHHGSRNQDPELVGRLGARLALISVGEGNDYGHPAPQTLRMLRRDHMLVRRTDTDGDLAVVVSPDSPALRVRTRMPRPAPTPGT